MIDTFREFCYNSSLREHRFRAVPEVSKTVLDELKTANKVVGIKQLRRALAAGKAKKVFVARDADPALTEPILAMCRRAGVEIVTVSSMRLLGQACAISVDAAAAAII